MLLDDAVTDVLLAKDYTPQTRQRCSYALAEFVTWATEQGVTAVEDVTASTVRRYLAYLRERPNLRWGTHLSGETQHSRAAVVRMFLRFCAREGWADDRMVARAFQDMPKRPKKVIEVLCAEQYARLVRAADSCYVHAIRLRDKALLALLMDCGLRAQEVCTLTVANVFLSAGASYLRVEGKGRKQREVGMGKQAALALHRYLTRGRPDQLRPYRSPQETRESPYVFLGRGGHPLSPNAIDKVLYRLEDVAGPEHFRGVRVSAHSLRHSFAVHFMEAGGDVFVLSRILGHENIATTTRYLGAYHQRAARTAPSVLDQLR